MRGTHATRRAGHLRWFLSAAVMLVVLGSHPAIGSQSPIADQPPHRLQVSRFSGVALTERAVDQILAKMSQVLQTADNGSNDVSCDVEFTRDGSISAFTKGNGMIVTPRDFSDIDDLPGDVKIVNIILWCHDKNDQEKRNRRINLTTGGCASRRSFVTVEALLHLPYLAGIVWAHEFGHVSGSDDRIGMPHMVMNSSVDGGSTQINESECQRYLRSTSP